MKQDMLNTYQISNISDLISENPYVGRGIICGMTSDGKKAVSAYFIMGRSANSRNRVFVEDGEDLMIRPFDESKVEDPSLIIYYPLRMIPHGMIVTNGDQTDTIRDFKVKGLSFIDALRTRGFEPDVPNLTPRISSEMDFDLQSYSMSILKAGDPLGSTCSRYFFEYSMQPSLGHFIHTYETDGDPIPTFIGEPERINIPSDIDAFTLEIWDSLDYYNKISLYVRYIDLELGTFESRLLNKYGAE